MKHTLMLRNSIVQSHEVALVYLRPIFNDMEYVHRSQDIELLMRRYLTDENIDLKEYMWLMCFTRANRLLCISRLSMGSVHGTVVSAKEIFQIAFINHASAIALIHNHPSGNLKPSRNDIKLTENIQQFGNLIDITLLDHLIITRESYYSMADNNTI